MAKSEALPELSLELWEKGWVIWSQQRKRARMAQFIIDHLKQSRLAQWIDITKGKFQLCNWQDLAQEWYSQKERGSDITDATSMLRKGLPRAFPGLVEIKSEAVKEGTQYVKRVFQANDVLLHDVLRCALQADFHHQDVPSSSGDGEKQILHGSIRHTQSAGTLIGSMTTQPKMYHGSFSQPSLPLTHGFIPGHPGLPLALSPQIGSGFSMQQEGDIAFSDIPFSQHFSSLMNKQGVNVNSPMTTDYQLASAESSSVATTRTCHADSTWSTDSAIDSIDTDEILRASLSPVTQVQSPVTVTSGQSPYRPPFGGCLTNDLYNPAFTADCYRTGMSPIPDEDVSTLAESVSTLSDSVNDSSYPVTPQPDQSQIRKYYYHHL